MKNVDEKFYPMIHEYVDHDGVYQRTKRTYMIPRDIYKQSTGFDDRLFEC